ncbi:MAG: AMP-binding protein [Candidatus Omnitrophota bacterium]
MEENLVIHKVFAQVSSQYSDRICLQIKKGSGWERWSYGQIEDLSLKIGVFLIKAGFKKGDFAALCLENRPEWGIIYLGIITAGLVSVPFDTQLTGQEIENLINDCAAKIIFVSNTVFQAKKIDKIKTGLNKIVILDLDIEKDNFVGLEQVKSTSSEGVTWPEVLPEDIASLIYTSGTTGEPKGVMLTHKNFCSNFQSIYKLKLFSDKDNFISILPLHHCFPFIVTLILPIFCRAPVTYVSSLKTDELLTSMREAGVTVLAGVPQLFYMFYAQAAAKMDKMPFLFKAPLLGLIWILWQVRRLTGINLNKQILSKIHRPFGKTLRFFISGGAKLNEAAARFLMKIGFTILEGYGLTETSPGVAFNPLRRQKIGSVGKVIPDVEVKIVDPDATGMGEVVIKGPNVMKGYYKRPDETSSVLKDGWFYSGDLGHMGRDGYLYITGRIKEMIVLSSGKKIFPEEIESHYAKSPYIKEMCVIGIGEEEGQSLSAVVVPDAEYCRKAGEGDLNSKLRWELENLSNSLAPYQRIKGFIIVKENIPRTRLGKIMRYEVKKKYLDEFKGIKSKVAQEEEVPATEEDLKLLSDGAGKKIMEVLAKHAKLERQIVLTDHLELDLGIDSLGRVELTMALEQALNAHIPDEVLAQASTVKELILEIEKLATGTEAQGGPAGQAKIPTSWDEVLNKEPAKEMIKKLYITPNLTAILGMLLFTGMLRLVFRTIWRLKISGTENIPKAGRCILCVSHGSYLDGFIVASSVPAGLRKDLYIVGFEAFFDHFLIRNIIKYIRVIPIDPGMHFVEAMQASSYVLKNNKIVCIFPEGERTIDGEVKKFKKGAGILAKELNIPMVPVYIKGSYESWPRTRRFPKPYPIKITFGKPVDFEELKKEGARLGAKDDYEAIAFGIREEVVKLR